LNSPDFMGKWMAEYNGRKQSISSESTIGFSQSLRNQPEPGPSEICDKFWMIQFVMTSDWDYVKFLWNLQKWSVNGRDMSINFHVTFWIPWIDEHPCLSSMRANSESITFAIDENHLEQRIGIWQWPMIDVGDRERNAFDSVCVNSESALSEIDDLNATRKSEIWYVTEYILSSMSPERNLIW
jgi:hypothetical protein